MRNFNHNTKFYFKQECIPVRCVPAARRPYAGVCFPGGVSAPGRGVSAPDGVGSGGMTVLGGLSQGVSARGGYPSMH